MDELRAVAAGVRVYLKASGCCSSATRFRVAAPVWISTVDRDFALARVAMVPANGAVGPHATVVLVHTASGRWTVIALGTAKLACGVAPSVRRDWACDVAASRGRGPRQSRNGHSGRSERERQASSCDG